MNYKEILKLKWPAKVPVQFTNDTYAGIVWNALDNTPNPTQAELDAAISSINCSGFSGAIAVTESDGNSYFMPNVRISYNDSVVAGAVVAGSGQILKTSFFDIPIMSGNTLIPFDSTKPTTTEGTQLFNFSITPKTVSSKIGFRGACMVDASSDKRSIVIAIFRGSVCVHSAVSNVANSGKPTNLAIEFVDSPATDQAVTYSVRIGGATSGTWYLNQAMNGSSSGGTSVSTLTVTEYS